MTDSNLPDDIRQKDIEEQQQECLKHWCNHCQEYHWDKKCPLGREELY